MAVVQQPLAGGNTVEMMAHPGLISGVPRGLEYLTQVDQLICKQSVEVLEAVTGWETKNKYRITNSVGQQVYFAFEESGLCMRQCCGSARGFIIHITDKNQQEILRIERPFLCCKGCCWCGGPTGCCAYPVYVNDIHGTLLGTVHIEKSCFHPHFGIYDDNGVQIYDTWGPLCLDQCVCGCKGDVNFPLKETGTDNTVANISKIWDGVARNFCTDADTFGISFLVNLDVKHKALMIGAVFVIDFMVFENQ